MLSSSLFTTHSNDEKRKKGSPENNVSPFARSFEEKTRRLSNSHHFHVSHSVVPAHDDLPRQRHRRTTYLSLVDNSMLSVRTNSIGCSSESGSRSTYLHDTSSCESSPWPSHHQFSILASNANVVVIICRTTRSPFRATGPFHTCEVPFISPPPLAPFTPGPYSSVRLAAKLFKEEAKKRKIQRYFCTVFFSFSEHLFTGHNQPNSPISDYLLFLGFASILQ